MALLNQAFNDPLPEPLRNLLVLFCLLQPLREKVLVELEAVLVHRVHVAQSRDHEVYDRPPRRNNPGEVHSAEAVAKMMVEGRSRSIDIGISTSVAVTVVATVAVGITHESRLKRPC